MRMMCECEGGYFRTYSARTTVVFLYIVVEYRVQCMYICTYSFSYLRLLFCFDWYFVLSDEMSVANERALNNHCILL
jgi:hypothetical protein